MTTTTALANMLPSSIPKLEASGLNWAIFLIHFQDAIEAKGYWGHFNGMMPWPDPVATATAEDAAILAQWDQDKRLAKSLLTQKLPDLALMHIHKAKTVKERWDIISIEYTEKGTFAQTDLLTHFLESKCPEKGNIWQFLDKLCVKCEELATVGIKIDEKDYRSTIISSLPIPLTNFASNQMAFTKIYSPTKSIIPDLLISLISEEYKCQCAQHAWQSGTGKAKDNDKDEALSVVLGKNKGKPCKPHGICWNCRDKGHYKDKCPQPIVKKDDAPRKGSTSAITNAVIQSDSDEEGAFFMEDDDDPDMPNLGDMSDSEDDSDHQNVDEVETNWFTNDEDKVESGWDSKELSGIDWSECSLFIDVDLDSEATIPDEYAAHMCLTSCQWSPKILVGRSCTLCHLVDEPNLNQGSRWDDTVWGCF